MIGPAEYFWLIVLGLSLIAVAAKGDTLRGFIMATMGLLLSFIGRSTITGELRFTFNNMYLEDGFSLVILAIGLFALSEGFRLAEKGGSVSNVKVFQIDRNQVIEGIKFFLRYPFITIRSALVGAVIGIAPGIGISTANVVAYLLEKNSAPDGETFGKGNGKGVLAPEAANNACILGQQIPMWALGIPGGSGGLPCLWLR